MGLQRLYLVLLAIAIGAIFMGSFTLRGALESRKPKGSNNNVASKPVSNDPQAKSAVPEAAASNGVPFASKAPLISVAETDLSARKFAKLDDFFAAEKKRREGGGEPSEPTALADFARNLNAAEADELSSRAIRIDASALEKEFALAVLVAIGGEMAVEPLGRVALALIPPAAPEEVQAIDRRIRESAAAALNAYSEGSPGAPEAREILKRMRPQ
jgi:hypothetical protein